MVWDLIADSLIYVIGLICYFVLIFHIKIISYPQHMNTIAFTIQWAGCPKGCSCLSIVTAKMTMLRQDLILKNKIIKNPTPKKTPKNKQQQKKAHTDPADCRQLLLFQFFLAAVSKHLLNGLQQPQASPLTKANNGPKLLFQLSLSICPQHK